VAAGYQDLVWLGSGSTDLSADNGSILATVRLPDQKIGFYQFHIDPAIFGDKPGYWYRWNGVYERQANNRAFRVVIERPPENWTPNLTERQELELPPPPPVVPQMNVSDYLVARGDPINITFPYNRSSVYLFGRVNGIYDKRVDNGTVSFNVSEIQALETGSYILMYHDAGKDRRFDWKIEGTTLRYFDDERFEVRTIDLTPLSPMVILDRFRWYAKINDDEFTEYEFEVQNPTIQIISADSIITNETNQIGVLQVRGYTNLINETPLSVTLDIDKTPEELLGHTRRQNTWNTTARATDNPGAMRYFDYGVPLYLGLLSPGQHTVTVKGGRYDTEMTVPFFIYEAPAEHYRPNETIRYVGGNEWKPTPTPEIQIQKEVVTQIVERVVTVEVTPAPEVVKEQQGKVIHETILTVFGIAAVLFALWYLVHLYYARKAMKQSKGDRG
jgi:hypothetical protein